MAVEFLDRYSRGTTICHRLPARLKILLTLATMVLAALLPIRLWPLHGCLGCVILGAHSLAEIPLGYLFRRVLLLLPIVAFTALAAPLSRGFTAGWELAATLLVRALLTVLAALWLVNTTPFDQLLAGLRKLGLPRMFVALLAFTYRYLFVVFDELARMRTAQRARTFGRRTPWQAWKSAVQLVAMLLVRSMTRAERIHDAMLARGWQGDVHPLD
ncbi:MAG: cobalt ECF transporter T component CbiQ [Planctomycetales bacterium]